MKRHWLGVCWLVAACSPAPERLVLGSSTHAIAGASRVSVHEGDVLVFTATPVDDGGRATKLCVEVASSAPDVIDPLRAHGDCTAFVAPARQAGTATLHLSARGTVADLTIEVTAP